MYFSDDKELYRTVGSRIKQKRKEKGFTQQQLCEKVGISLSYLSKIEAANCDKSFSLSILNQLANALKVDVTDFFKECE